MNAALRDFLTDVDGDLLQTGHWSPADDYLRKLSELLSLQSLKPKDFITLITRVCPGVVEFRVLKDHVTREPKYLVKSLLVTRKKFRGYPLRSQIEITESAKYSRRPPIIFEELPAHVGAMGNWKPLGISNMSAALRAGKGCVAASSDFVLDGKQHERLERETEDWQESEWHC